jgi:hypothetical protein
MCLIKIQTFYLNLKPLNLNLFFLCWDEIEKWVIFW